MVAVLGAAVRQAMAASVAAYYVFGGADSKQQPQGEAAGRGRPPAKEQKKTPAARCDGGSLYRVIDLASLLTLAITWRRNPHRKPPSPNSSARCLDRI